MRADLKFYIEQNIIPKYAAFDAAHREDHVSTVIEDSMKLANYYPVDKNMVYTIAAYHDLGLCEGRERHHIVSGKILLADEHLKNWFTEDQLLLMRDAIEDHRASNKHEPRTIYGKIVAEADRQIDCEVTIRRTIQYGLSKHPELDIHGQYERALDHIRNKYGEGGYLHLYIPESPNSGRLEEFRKLIASPIEFHKEFVKIYHQETMGHE